MNRAVPYVVVSGLAFGILECLLLSIPFWLGYSIFHHGNFLLYGFFRACLLFVVFWYYKERIGKGVFKFKTGMLLTLFLIIISTIIYILYFNYFLENISNDYISKLRVSEHETLVSEGASGAQIGYIETFTTRAMLSAYSVIQIFVSYAVLGLMFSILLHTKKSNLDSLDEELR